MTAGLWVAIAAVLVAVGFGLYRRHSDGRFRGAPTPAAVRAERAANPETEAEVRAEPETEVEVRAERASKPGEPPSALWAHVQAAIPDAERGDRATLLQFSSAFCAPCRATRRTLADVADAVPGVVHVEVDAEHHLELVRELGILRTPTTLVLDGQGAEVARAAGAPRTEQVLGALP